MTDDIPLIDIAPLLSGDPKQATEVAAAIGAACRGIGFFYISGHGISEDQIRDVFARSQQFFALPDAEKRKVAYSAQSGNRGWVPMKGESLDPSRPADLKEAYNIGLEMAADDPAILAGAAFRAVNLWPDDSEFKAAMLAWFDAVWRIGRDLHRAFAADLGLAQDYFEDKLDRPLATLRLLHYPARPPLMEAGQLGAGEHTDYGNLTLLMTDDAGGLEVRSRSGEWLEAPYIPGAFVCNIGDCLMRWSNEFYVSTPHRVVNPAGRERYSIAFFLDPNPDALVECLPGCSTADNPPRYPPVTGADYLRQRLDATYKSGGLA
jgi:isopenicillin N synthase-like dioxygenase